MYIPIFFYLVFFSLFLFITPFQLLAETNDSSKLPDIVQTILYRTQQAMVKDDFSKARLILEDYINQRNGKAHFQIFYFLGNTNYHLGELDNAYKAYIKAYEMDPDYFPLCQNLARVCFESHRQEEAAVFFEKTYRLANSIKKTPLDPELLYYAATCHYELKQYQKAIVLLEELISTHEKNDIQWQQLLIYTLVGLGDKEKLELLLFKYLNNHPENFEFWLLFGQLKLEKKKYNQTAGILEIAYSIKSPTSQQLRELADIYLFLGLPVEAVKTLKRISTDLGFADYKLLGRSFFQAQRFRESLEYYEKAILFEPEQKIYCRIGEINYQMGEWRKARKFLEKCLESGNDDMYLLSAYAAFEMNDYTAARESFKKISKESNYYKAACEGLNLLKQYGNSDK
jgi:tetratricopeptide (TPR) repeat protein